jgi:hypothetical protein
LGFFLAGLRLAFFAAGRRLAFFLAGVGFLVGSALVAMG